MFENYRRLTSGGRRKDLHVYEKLLQTMVSPQLAQQSSSWAPSKSVEKVLKDMQNANVEMPARRRELFQVKALVLEGRLEEALAWFQEKFLKEHAVQFQRLKIKYFLMSLLKEQTVSGEYVVAEAHISRFINTLSAKFLLHMFHEEQAVNQELRALIAEDHGQSVHEFMRLQEHQDNFLRIKKLVEAGRLELKVSPQMLAHPEDLHYDELFIIQNYDRLNKEFNRQRAIRKLTDRALFKKREFDAYAEIKTPKDLARIKPLYDKETLEIQREIQALRAELQRSPAPI